MVNTWGSWELRENKSDTGSHILILAKCLSFPWFLPSIAVPQVSWTPCLLRAAAEERYSNCPGWVSHSWGCPGEDHLWPGDISGYQESASFWLFFSCFGSQCSLCLCVFGMGEEERQGEEGRGEARQGDRSSWVCAISWWSSLVWFQLPENEIASSWSFRHILT